MTYQNVTIGIALCFCAYATYTDLKTGKIKNSCSFLLIYAGLLAQGVYLFSGSTTPISVFSVIFGGALLAFALYWFGTVGAGDAKLLWGLSMVLPPSLFANFGSRAMTFPPAVLLLNILVVYFWFVLFYVIQKSSFAQKKSVLHAMVKHGVWKALYTYLLDLLYFMAFASWVYTLLFYVQLQLGQFSRLILVILFFYAFNKILQKFRLKRHWVYLPMFSATVLMGLISSGSFIPFLRSLVFLIVVYSLFNFFIQSVVLYLDSMVMSREVAIADLQPGMIPAERLLQVQDETGVRYEKELSSSPNWLDANVIVSPAPEGLSAQKIQELQQLAAAGHFQSFGDQLMIQHAFHFAPVISAGTLLTLVCQGPLYSVFLR